MDFAHGFPIVELNQLAEFLEGEGVRPWLHLEPPVSLEEYAARDLSETDRTELGLFVPKVEVSTLQHPNGSVFHGFHTVGRKWAVVFCILPGDEVVGDLVVLVAGYLHGSDTVSVSLPAGNITKKDLDFPDPWTHCARREFTEETGIPLIGVARLTEREVFVAGGQSQMFYHPFVGLPQLPVFRANQELDDTERLNAFLMPLDEWLVYIGFGLVESCSISTTYLALRALGRLQFP